MSKTKGYLLDNPIRFSQSRLWEIQRNFFQTMGIQAWDEQVPFYISSNMFIATRYAGLLIEAIKDLIKQDPSLRKETFYFLEIGSGTGKFSFCFLKAFERLLKIHHLDDLQYCYIISDVVDKNIQFCEENSSLQPYIENNKLDFACFNIVSDQKLYLKRRQVDYQSLSTKAPLLTIANYVLDCVKLDVFKIDKEGLHELQLAISTRYKDFNVSESKYLEDLRLAYQTKLIDPKDYYEDPVLNKLLRDYLEKYRDQDIYFSVPLGAIDFIEHLSGITNNKFILMIGDSGISKEQDLHLMSVENIASFNGCYAFMVNFCFIAQYFKECGNGSILSQTGRSFIVNIFYKGIADSALSNMNVYYHQFMESMGPKEYCDVFQVYAANSYRFPPEALVSFLKLSEYDPDAYGLVQNRLLELQPIYNPFTLSDLDQAIQKTRENIYHCAMGQDISNFMGAFYTLHKQYPMAIDLFKQSIDIFKSKSEAYRNLALVYENQRDEGNALKYFQEAYQHDRRDDYSKEKALSLEGKPTYAWVKSVIRMGVVVLGIIAAYFVLTA